MKLDPSQVFRVLEPPAGGVARMRAKLAAERHRRPFEIWWLGPVAAALVVAIAFFAFSGRNPMPPTGAANDLISSVEFDRLLGRETEPNEFRVTQGEMAVAVNQLPSSNPRVRLYEVELAPRAAAQPEELL